MNNIFDNKTKPGNIIEKALLTIPKNLRKFTTQAFGGQSEAMVGALKLL